jgi:Ni,Fe-hydrogenase III small subunit/NAD-dependent dihydropyrimidine dehydrogenase PreA subunit
MWRILKERLKQKYQTFPFPIKEESLPERFMGLPSINRCQEEDCDRCIERCPVEAISKEDPSVLIDLGKCIFCGECTFCNAIDFTKNYSLASTSRDDLHIGIQKRSISKKTKDILLEKLFQKSLKLREVSAGGCNACEADTNVLSTIGWDIGRFGVQFVASPRHADGLFVTGPVTKNMETALLKTYEAIPDPKIVIACGSCAIDGGPFRRNKEVLNGVDKLINVDLYIPGCPPHPATILDGILRFLKRA